MCELYLSQREYVCVCVCVCVCVSPDILCVNFICHRGSVFVSGPRGNQAGYSPTVTMVKLGKGLEESEL